MSNEILLVPSDANSIVPAELRIKSCAVFVEIPLARIACTMQWRKVTDFYKFSYVSQGEILEKENQQKTDPAMLAESDPSSAKAHVENFSLRL